MDLWAFSEKMIGLEWLCIIQTKKLHGGVHVLLDAFALIRKRVDEDMIGATQWELINVVSVKEVVEAFGKLAEEMGLEMKEVWELARRLEEVRSKHVLSWPGHS